MNKNNVRLFVVFSLLMSAPGAFAQVNLKMADLETPPIVVKAIARNASEITTLRRCFAVAQPYLDKDEKIKQVVQAAWSLFDHQQLVFAYPEEQDKGDRGLAYTDYGGQFIDQLTMKPLSIKASIKFSDRGVNEIERLAKISDLKPLDLVHIINITIHEFKHIIDKSNGQSYAGGLLEFESHGYRAGAQAVLLLVDDDPERIVARDHYNELRFSRAQKLFPKDTWEWVGLMLYMAGKDVEKMPIEGYNAKFNVITDNKDFSKEEDRNKVVVGLTAWMTDLESKIIQLQLGANFETFLLKGQLMHLNFLLDQIKRFAGVKLQLDWQEISELQEKLSDPYQKVNEPLTRDYQRWDKEVKPILWR